MNEFLDVKEIFDIAVMAFEVVAVVVLIVGTAYWLLSSLTRLFQGAAAHEAYRIFRKGFSKTLLVTLDVMVAADIILTVTLDLSLEALSALGLLVLIRTFLHFVLEVEATGRWPWHEARDRNDAQHESG